MNIPSQHSIAEGESESEIESITPKGVMNQFF